MFFFIELKTKTIRLNFFNRTFFFDVLIYSTTDFQQRENFCYRLTVRLVDQTIGNG